MQGSNTSQGVEEIDDKLSAPTESKDAQDPQNPAQVQSSSPSSSVDPADPPVDAADPPVDAADPPADAADPADSTDDSNNTSLPWSSITRFVSNILGTVVATEHSIHSCAGSLQRQFGHDPNLILACIKAMTNYFLVVDNPTKLIIFYIFNDLVQYDSRFRLPILRHALPSIGLTVSLLSNKAVYLKTVDVWEERKVYPSEICRSVERLFRMTDEFDKYVIEYEQRLSSLTDMLKIRSAKNVELLRIYCESPMDSGADSIDLTHKKPLTAAAIMAATTPELKKMAVSTRALLVVTQGIIDYTNRLFLDWSSHYDSQNAQQLAYILRVLQQYQALKEHS